jgi:hypothetical protein
MWKEMSIYLQKGKMRHSSNLLNKKIKFRRNCMESQLVAYVISRMAVCNQCAALHGINTKCCILGWILAYGEAFVNASACKQTSAFDKRTNQIFAVGKS